MTTPVMSLTRSGLLRPILYTNAVVTCLSGLGLLATARQLEPWTGIPSLFLLIAGGLFLPYAALLWYGATRAHAARRVGWIAVIGDSLWVIDSVILLAMGWLPLTNAGWWTIVVQACVIGCLAEAQFIALRRDAASS